MPARRALDLARNSSVSRRRWTIEQSYTDERGPARSAPHLLTGKCIIFGRSGRKTAQKANCGATTGSAPRHFFRTVTLPEVRGGTRADDNGSAGPFIATTASITAFVVIPHCIATSRSICQKAASSLMLVGRP